MSSGGHYEIIEPSDYSSRFDELVAGNTRLEQAHAGLVQWLERAPKRFPVSNRLHGDFWEARLYGPPWLTVFYSIDEERRIVTLNGMVHWP